MYIALQKGEDSIHAIGKMTNAVIRYKLDQSN